MAHKPPPEEGLDKVEILRAFTQARRRGDEDELRRLELEYPDVALRLAETRARMAEMVRRADHPDPPDNVVRGIFPS